MRVARSGIAGDREAADEDRHQHGDFMAASVGSVERMEYVLLAKPVARTMAAESIATAGQVVADEATVAHLDPGCSAELTAGFHTVRCDPGQALDSFEIKAERRRPEAPSR